jgi:Ser/Thr protein kinase RdoA (MazF antagonist)
MTAAIPIERARQAELLLGRALAAEGRALVGCTLEPQHTRHRGRALARLSLLTRGADGARTDRVACKWFGSVAEAEQCHAVLSWLWRTTFAASDSDGLAIPKPRYLFRGLALVVLEWAPGTPLSQAQPADPERYRQAARWLLKLHAAPIPAQPPRATGARQRFDRARRARLLLERDPALSGLAGPLLREAARAQDPGSRCLVHGDFQPDNIVIDGAGLTAIDFDAACSSHPAADVGHFIAQLWSAQHFGGLPLEAADRLVEPFLDEYRRGMAPGLGEPKLSAFVANAALEIAAYVLVLAPAKHAAVESFLAQVCSARPCSL